MKYIILFLICITGCAGMNKVALRAKAQVQSKIMAGVDKSTTQSAGGNIYTAVTNNIRIYQGLIGIFITILGFMKSHISELNKSVGYLSESRKKYQDRFLKLLSPEYAKLVKEENICT